METPVKPYEDTQHNGHYDEPAKPTANTRNATSTITSIIKSNIVSVVVADIVHHHGHRHLHSRHHDYDPILLLASCPPGPPSLLV